MIISNLEGARPRGYILSPGPRWRSASCPKKPALGHGYEASHGQLLLLRRVLKNSTLLLSKLLHLTIIVSATWTGSLILYNLQSRLWRVGPGPIVFLGLGGYCFVCL